MNKIVAFKCFKTRHLCGDQQSYDEFEKEVEILASISHPHIITFYGATMNPPRVGIIMEFCEHGDLEVFISTFREKYGMRYPIKEKLRMLFEITMAFTYLHSRSIIHRDLKLENVLVNSQMSCKLMDFGLSKIVDRMSQQKTKKVGTNVFMAPEISSGDDDYDEKCDIFSFGILVFVLLTENTMPYGKKAGMVELKVANNPDYRPDLEELGKCMVEEERTREWVSKICRISWSHDKDKRWSFSKLSDFFREKNTVFSRSKFKKVLAEESTEGIDRGKKSASVPSEVMFEDCLAFLEICKKNGFEVPKEMRDRYEKKKKKGGEEEEEEGGSSSSDDGSDSD